MVLVQAAVSHELRDWVKSARSGNPAAYDGPDLEEAERLLADVDALVEAARNVASWYPGEGQSLNGPLEPFGEFSKDERIGIYE